jgi:hypothetical protein
MDLKSIKQLVEQIAAVMGPALPSLLSKGGEEMAKSVGGALGKDVWDEARHLWNRILPVAQQSPGLMTAVEEVAQHPNNQVNIGVLQKELRKALQANAELASDMQKMMTNSGAAKNYSIKVKVKKMRDMNFS